jgi:hypothetical protein
MIVQDMMRKISNGDLETALDILYDIFNIEELKEYHDLLVNYSSRVNRALKDESRGLGAASPTITKVGEALRGTLGALNKDDYSLTKSEIRYQEYLRNNPTVVNSTVNNTTVNNISVVAVTNVPAKDNKFDPFFLSPEVTNKIEIFIGLMRKYIILAAQVNMILDEVHDTCIEFIGEIQESLMAFVTSENSEERDEILESLNEYHSSFTELETTARKEFKRAIGNEKNQVAQILKEVKVGNKKNLELFKAAYAAFEQLEKSHLVSMPKVLPVNPTSLGLLVKKWIRLANS